MLVVLGWQLLLVVLVMMGMVLVTVTILLFDNHQSIATGMTSPDGRPRIAIKPKQPCAPDAAETIEPKQPCVPDAAETAATTVAPPQHRFFARIR